MSPKDEILRTVKEALANHVITESDISSLLTPQPIPQIVPEPAQISHDETLAPAPHENAGRKLGITDILFYLAGIILYAAIMVMASQSGSNSRLMLIAIPLIAGLSFWVLAYVFGTQSVQNDTRQGLVNSLMLTGSLAVSSGGFIAASETANGSSGPSVVYAIAITMAMLGAFHLLYDAMFRHVILVVLGTLLLIGAFPTFLGALLYNLNPPADVWALIGLATGALLGCGGVIISRSAAGREHLKGSFISLGAFVALSSVYFATLAGSVAVVWEILLPGMIYGAFFISIKRRSAQFLVNGSFFLVLFLVTVSFKYFSGFGVVFSLILAAAGLLATAFVASSIHKKYIKEA